MKKNNLAYCYLYRFTERLHIYERICDGTAVKGRSCATGSSVEKGSLDQVTIQQSTVTIVNHAQSLVKIVSFTNK